LAGKKTRGKTYLYVILYNLLYFVNSPCFLPAILHFSSNRQVKCDGRLILYASCNSPGNAQARLGKRNPGNRVGHRDPVSLVVGVTFKDYNTLFLEFFRCCRCIRACSFLGCGRGSCRAGRLCGTCRRSSFSSA
jgi:hypothetical protein